MTVSFLLFDSSYTRSRSSLTGSRLRSDVSSRILELSPSSLRRFSLPLIIGLDSNYPIHHHIHFILAFWMNPPCRPYCCSVLQYHVPLMTLAGP